MLLPRYIVLLCVTAREQTWHPQAAIKAAKAARAAAAALAVCAPLNALFYFNTYDIPLEIGPCMLSICDRLPKLLRKTRWRSKSKTRCRTGTRTAQDRSTNAMWVLIQERGWSHWLFTPFCRRRDCGRYCVTWTRRYGSRTTGNRWHSPPPDQSDTGFWTSTLPAGG